MIKLKNLINNIEFPDENIQFLWDNRIFLFLRGSHIYQTNNENSDYDITVIVHAGIAIHGDEFNNILEVNLNFNGYDIDFQFINETEFLKMINKHHIIALESLWLTSDYFIGNILKYKNYFILDKWLLRQTISSIVNNSWAKCHKKLTVKKDYDYYRAIKSIFHCLRLYDIGIQIATYGKIINYSNANKYWNNLYLNNKDKIYTWDELKQTYQPILNKLHSEFVKLCPKPKNI